MECSHKYSDKTTDQMIHLYNESPEYQDVLGVLGPEVQIVDKAPAGDPAEHTYPISFAYVQIHSTKHSYSIAGNKLDSI